MLLTEKQLLAKLKAAKTTAAKYDVLYGQLMLLSSHANKRFSEALKYAKKLNDEIKIAAVNRLWSIELLNNASYKEGLEKIKVTVEIYQRHNLIPQYYSAIGVEGSYYSYLGMYNKAIEILQKSDKYFHEANIPRHRISVLVSMGIAYFKMEDYDTARSYFEKALHLKDDSTRNRRTVILMNIGNCYNQQKNYTKAEYYYKKALDESKVDPNPTHDCYLLLNLASLYLNRKQYKTAIKYYLLCDKAAEDVGDVLLQSCYQLSECYLNLGNYAEAKKWADKCRLVEKKVKHKDPGTYLAYSEYYSATGNYKKALANYKKYADTSKALYQKQSMESLRNSQIAYETDLHQREKENAEKRSTELETALKQVSEQKQIVEKEKKISESLLLNILPVSVADELKANGKAEPKYFENVTVMFADIKGFTKAAEKLSPAQLVNEIDYYFRAFDEIIGKYKIEKIKTIGDAYLCASGVPVKVKNSAIEIVNAAIDMQKFIADTKAQYIKAGKLFFEMRIGIHTGPLVAGIVGEKKYGYDIWGDTVNTAARMEQHGEVGLINISQNTQQQIAKKFTTTYRGEIDAKNKGMLKMYFVG